MRNFSTSRAVPWYFGRTLHIVDVRLTCLINITYLLTYGNAEVLSINRNQNPDRK